MNVNPGFFSNNDENEWKTKHAKYAWTCYVVIMLGIWLIVNLPTFGISNVQMAFSDTICGLLLIVFGIFSLSAKNNWAPWAACSVGIWLQIAPLIFWSPSAFGYLNDTITGLLVIALTLVIPGTPGMIEDDGPEIPSGWSYNPSAWVQRLPVIFLTCICWFISRYMAAYQLGYIHSIWDPVFGEGTLRVITSNISKAFPISDAGLGAFVYTIEALMGAKGGVRRWRTMPWIVALFGLLVIPAGLISIIMIMMQPLFVGAWCFWCLLTAVCMLIMIALTIDEVIASVQYLRDSREAGFRFRDIFFKGGPALNFRKTDDKISPQQKTFFNFFKAGFRGVSFTWTLILSIILGIWLLFHKGPHQTAVNIGHIIGALTITFSIIAMAEVLRTARFINMILGAFCLVIPFIAKAPAIVTWKAIIVGILLIVLNLPKGKIKEKYGSWQRSIR